MNTAQQQQDRLQAGGWFARSFASTSGVMLAVFILTVGIPLLLMFLFCAGIMFCGVLGGAAGG